MKKSLSLTQHSKSESGESVKLIKKIQQKCVPMPCEDIQNLIPDASGECQSVNDDSNCNGDNMEMQINPYGIGK